MVMDNVTLVGVLIAVLGWFFLGGNVIVATGLTIALLGMWFKRKGYK